MYFLIKLKILVIILLILVHILYTIISAHEVDIWSMTFVFSFIVL